jgi:DNA polymerase-3 subunit delta
MPESSIIVFIESLMDKRSRLYKKVNELGYAVELGRQPEKDIKNWVLRILKEEGKQISSSNMDLFLSMTGDDMDNIRTELDKLISFLGEREAVSSEDIEAICTRQISSRIFDMITAVAQKKQELALRYYRDLLALREPPLRILFLLTRQFNQLLQVKELSRRDIDRKELAKKAGITPFIAGKIINQASAFSADILIQYIEKCANAEEAVKTGRMTDQLAVELMIVTLSS